MIQTDGKPTIAWDPNFRDAHAWLRGYSDARAGKSANAQHNDQAEYQRGYAAGRAAE